MGSGLLPCFRIDPIGLAPEQFFRLPHTKRRGKPVALAILIAQSPQVLELVQGGHALGDRMEVELTAEGHDRLDYLK